MLDKLMAIIERAISRMDYYALYPCRVVQQNGDGTLDLSPDSARLSGLSHVPVRLGLPGATVKVDSGSRVLLGFENGSPSAPVATIWEQPMLLELCVDAKTKVQVMAPAIELGGDEYSALCGEVIKMWADTHIHGTGVGPSSPPLQPVPPTGLSKVVKLKGER